MRLMRLITAIFLFSLSCVLVAARRIPPQLPHNSHTQKLLNNISRRSKFYDVDFSPDGRTIASASGDRIIRMWDVVSGRELKRIDGHAGSVCFSTDGKKLAAGFFDSSVKIWDVDSCTLKETMDGHAGVISCVTFSPDSEILASSSWDKKVILWNTATGELIKILKGHTDKVTSLSFSLDGRLIASASDDFTIRLWDVMTGKEINRLEGHSNRISSVSFSPAGDLLASASNDGTVCLWDFRQGKEVKRLEVNSDTVASVCFSPDGGIVASAYWDINKNQGIVRFWESITYQIVRPFIGDPFQGHSEKINSICFSPDGKILASASDDRTILLWDTITGWEIGPLTGHMDQVNSVCFNNEGTTLASGSWDNTIYLWDTETGTEKKRLKGHSQEISCIAFSPDGHFLASASHDKSVRLWNVIEEKGQEIGEAKKRPDWVSFVDFHPSGNTLATASGSNIRLWRVDNGEQISILQGHTQLINCVDFSPEGDFLASCSEDETIRLWDIESGETTRQFVEHGRFIRFSPDGRILASASHDNKIRLWDVSTGMEIKTLEGHTDRINSLSFSNDGQTIASASWDQTIRFWNVITGEQIAQLIGHLDKVSSIEFNPKKNIVASGSADRTIRFWDLDTKKEIWRLISGQKGNWISCKIGDECFRRDDGTLLVDVIDNNVVPISPPPGQAKGPIKLEVVSAPQSLNTVDGEVNKFTIQIKNIGSIKVFWLRVGHDITRDKANKNPLVFYPPPIKYCLEPGGTADFSCQVSAHAEYKNPQEIKTSLDLKITSRVGEHISHTIKVKTSAPGLNFLQAKLRNQSVLENPLKLFFIPSTVKPTLLVSLKNTGEQALKEVLFEARVSGKTYPLGTIEQDISAEEIISLSFILPREMQIDKDTRISLTAYTQNNPIHVWEFLDQPILSLKLSFYLYLALLLIISILVILFLFYRPPLIFKLTASPEILLREVPIEKLGFLKWLLKFTRRLEMVLETNKIKVIWLDYAIKFRKNKDTKTQADLLTNRIREGAGELDMNDPDLSLYKFHLEDNFMLKIKTCSLLFITSEISIEKLSSKLGSINFTDTAIIIINLAKKQLNIPADLPMKSKSGARFVIPDSTDLTRLLLSPRTQYVFSRLVASHFDNLIAISPYQIGGGVAKESIFFGRNQEIADIMERSYNNYLLIGTRQIGKTSLLRAIERRYQTCPQVDFYYISLVNGDILEPLAKALGLPLDISLSNLLTHLENTDGGRPPFFLIDEADLFIEAEAKKDYPLLRHFRRLKEQKICYFILAGFWKLYFYSTYDYQSPIFNFGETLFISTLEYDACYQLATKPMKYLNLEYESEDLVKLILQKTGNRANLISLACNQILKNVDIHTRVIKRQDIDSALASEELFKELYYWVQLAGRENDEDSYEMTAIKLANNLDRIIVYATIHLESFTQEKLCQLLKKYHCPFENEEVKGSLKRLEISYILKKEEANYIYPIPIFIKFVQSQAPKASLSNELKSRQALKKK